MVSSSLHFTRICMIKALNQRFQWFEKHANQASEPFSLIDRLKRLQSWVQSTSILRYTVLCYKDVSKYNVWTLYYDFTAYVIREASKTCHPFHTRSTMAIWPWLMGTINWLLQVYFGHMYMSLWLVTRISACGYAIASGDSWSCLPLHQDFRDTSTRGQCIAMDPIAVDPIASRLVRANDRPEVPL